MDMDYQIEILNEIYDIGEKLYANMGSRSEEGHGSVFNLLTDLGRILVGADRASFWKWDKANHQLWTTSATKVDKIVIPDDSGLVGKALKEKRVIVTNDPYSEPEFNSDVDKQTGYITFSVLVMPVADINGEYIGAFQIINKLGEDGFDEVEDVKKLSLAAFACGITLESETFFTDSQYDTLTGLKNRKGLYHDFMHKYAEYLQVGMKSPFAVFICDIDRFKRINDNYGHNIGDLIIKNVAGILSKHCPEHANAYRWGGDEFVVVMPGTELEECKRIAEEVRVEVKDSQVKASVLPIKATMSFGCSLYDRAKSIEENFAQADDNLYTAKDNGRNQVYG